MYLNEVSKLHELGSPGVVKILHSEVISVNPKIKKFVIVTELMQGSLSDLISEKGRFAEVEAISHMRDIIEVYHKSLFQKNNVHRDFKPANVLFNKLENGKL